MPPEEKGEVVPVPDNDKDGTQRIYDTLANQIQGMPKEIMKHSRFPLWAIIATINLLCRLVIANSDMTKEQLVQQVGDIFAAHKDDKPDKMLN